jgi:hypothetical protein
MGATALTGAESTLDVAANFDSMLAAAERAAALHPGKVHLSHYVIADRLISVRLVGDALGSRLTRAISHLRVADPDREPDLQIDMWDGAETGVSAPGCVPRGEAGSAGRTDVSPGGRFVLFEQARTRSVLDRTGKRIAGWVVAASQLSQYELGRPWHSELLLWQHDCSLQPLHAGFIERDGIGVLLAGPGGSGKSTTSLSCMQEGWSYLADDYVSVAQTGQRIIGYGAYNSAHLDPAHLQRFPRLVPGAIHGKLAREDKSLVLASDLRNVRLAGKAELRVIAFPRVVDRPESRWYPASKPEALLRLAPSSLLLLPYVQLGHSAFKTMSDVVMRLPTCWLDVGRDLAQLPRAVADMVAEVVKR